MRKRQLTIIEARSVRCDVRGGRVIEHGIGADEVGGERPCAGVGGRGAEKEVDEEGAEESCSGEGKGG